MIPVIILVFACWAASGVATSVKAALASEPARAGTGAAAGTSGSKSAAASKPSKANPTLGPGDITFGQWQRSLYRRWKTKARTQLPGLHRGKKLADLLGDITAASLAGAAIFGMGFISGTTWTAKRRSARNARTRPQGQTSAPKNGSTPSGSRRRPWQPRPGSPSTGNQGFRSRRRHSTQNPNPPRYSTETSDNTVIDAELTDDYQAPAASSSSFASSEYADLVLPELLAHNPTVRTTAPNGRTMATELLTIHHLLRWAQGAFEHAVGVVELSAVRARSAIERAEQALLRRDTAVARAGQALAVADTARQQAIQLEEAAARFSGLRMDHASMASIGVAITAAIGLAQVEQRRAEAEAVVAERAAALAAAEQVAADAAQASAQAAAIYGESVKNMHNTVQQHQMPHAEAQAITGNAAAHESVLAAN